MFIKNQLKDAVSAQYEERRVSASCRWSSSNPGAVSVPTISIAPAEGARDFPVGPINDRWGNYRAQLLFLESENPTRTSTCTPLARGSVSAGWRCTTRCSHQPDVSTLCTASRPAGRLPARGRHQGQALLPAEFARHDPPASGGFSGQASDIEIHAKEVLYLKRKLERDARPAHGAAIDVIERDTDRDNFMGAMTP